MLTSGFSNAPVSKFLLLGLVATSVVVNLIDAKGFFYIQVVPHIWDYRQLWRVLIWQACYLNSAEVLFAALTFYHMRVVERLWGSRKFISFLLATFPYTTALPPLLLTTVLRPLTFGHANFLPAGPTPILFALLAQYHAAIPHTYRWRLIAAPLLPASLRPSSTTHPQSKQSPQSQSSPSTSSSSRPTHDNDDEPDTKPSSLTLTSKTLTYLPALQLSLAAPPGSLFAAAIGWAIGAAYRADLLPGRAASWRVPSWLLGGAKTVPSAGSSVMGPPASGALGSGVGALGAGQRARVRGSDAGASEGFEGLRRRLEGERAGVVSGSGAGANGNGGSSGGAGAAVVPGPPAGGWMGGL